MDSVILQAATRIVMPVQLLLSLFFFFQGHNSPGGGFIGGLIAASAFTLHLIAFGKERTERLMRIPPRVLVSVGLLLALLAGFMGVCAGEPFLTGVWDGSVWLPLVGKVKLGSVLLFDFGVFLVVTGAVMAIVFLLNEEE
jgi:multicomponent Na+:H+ antiporter subunit B